MHLGTTILGRRHVRPAVVHDLTELMVEGTFRTGTYLVTVHNPICTDDGDLARALYGSFLPVPEVGLFPLPGREEVEREGVWGEVRVVRGRVRLSEGRVRRRLRVESLGDRPIQVGVLFFLKASSS